MLFGKIYNTDFKTNKLPMKIIKVNKSIYQNSQNKIAIYNRLNKLRR